MTVLVATFIILASVSIYFQTKNSPLQYMLSIIGIIIGLLIIGISFLNGNWQGLSLGTIGFAIFLGSAMAFIITAIIANMRDLKKQL